MIIVERPEQFLSFLKKFQAQSSIVIPVLSDSQKHPIVNTISILYISFPDGDYVLPFDHHDCQNLPVSYLEMVRKGAAPVFAVHKKALMHLMPLGAETTDLDGLMFMETGKVVDPARYMTPIHRYINTHHGLRDRINACIPLMQLVAFCEAYRLEVAPYCTNSPFLGTPGFTFHDAIVIPACYFMEKSGIRVDAALFLQHFGEKARQNIHNGLVYTEFNPYTSTSRVTSRFGGVNFSALDKKTGVRESIIHRYEKGALVLIDFESFHLRLIADLIGYDAPAEPMHQYFAKQYFETETPTQDEYEYGKHITFSNLYGTAQGQTIEYFRKVERYINKFWCEMNRVGMTQTETGRLLQLKNIPDPNPGKVFNYLLQLREMEVTLTAIHRLSTLYAGVESKIALYTYDSLLIDFSYADGKELLRETVRELEHGGKYPVRIYCGSHYNDLKNITELVKLVK